jgi:hypothetical protein
VTPGISAACAAGRLADRNSLELDVFVEDGIARHIVQAVLPTDLRRRVSILPIGSSSAIVRQMAASFKNRNRGECIALLDGDQRANARGHRRYFRRTVEAGTGSDAASEWFEERLAYLPGDSWPEWWVFSRLAELDIAPLADLLGIEEDELHELCEEAADAGKHREFYTLANRLSLPEEDVCVRVCHWLGNQDDDALGELRSIVRDHLE